MTLQMQMTHSITMHILCHEQLIDLLDQIYRHSDHLLIDKKKSLVVGRRRYRLVNDIEWTTSARRP